MNQNNSRNPAKGAEIPKRCRFRICCNLGSHFSVKLAAKARVPRARLIAAERVLKRRELQGMRSGEFHVRLSLRKVETFRIAVDDSNTSTSRPIEWSPDPDARGARLQAISLILGTSITIIPERPLKTVR